MDSHSCCWCLNPTKCWWSSQLKPTKFPVKTSTASGNYQGRVWWRLLCFGRHPSPIAQFDRVEALRVFSWQLQPKDTEGNVGEVWKIDEIAWSKKSGNQIFFHVYVMIWMGQHFVMIYARENLPQTIPTYPNPWSCGLTVECLGSCKIGSFNQSIYINLAGNMQ